MWVGLLGKRLAVMKGKMKELQQVALSVERKVELLVTTKGLRLAEMKVLQLVAQLALTLEHQWVERWEEKLEKQLAAMSEN